jgi:hypothetical protein
MMHQLACKLLFQLNLSLKQTPKKKLEQLSNEEVIKLVTEQMPFIDEKFNQQLAH